MGKEKKVKKNLHIRIFVVTLHSETNKNQKIMNFYTQNGWAGRKYNPSMTTKETAAAIREDLKKTLPGCKFSVSFHLASMCAEISVSLMSSAKDVRKEDTGYIQNVRHDDERLNEYGRKVMNTAREIIDAYNMSDCDGMIDYFNVKFYDSLAVGKWDKDYTVKPESKPAKRAGNVPAWWDCADAIEAAKLTLSPYGERAIVVRGDTKSVKELLKNLGGRFNPRLNGGAGWIFSARNEQKVREVLGI